MTKNRKKAFFLAHSKTLCAATPRIPSYRCSPVTGPEVMHNVNNAAVLWSCSYEREEYLVNVTFLCQAKSFILDIQANALAVCTKQLKPDLGFTS